MKKPDYIEILNEAGIEVEVGLFKSAQFSPKFPDFYCDYWMCKLYHVVKKDGSNKTIGTDFIPGRTRKAAVKNAFAIFIREKL